VRKRLSVSGLLITAGALLFAGCSSDGASSAGSRAKADDKVATTATTAGAAADSSALCAIFNRLAADGAGRDAQFSATTPEGWNQRIATTAAMVDAAPPEWKDEAETYHRMMEDRAELAAENGYVGVNDLPADVRSAFISSHAAMQADVSRLIAYMGQECGNRAS
jgi:hypothetical protein